FEAGRPFRLLPGPPLRVDWSLHAVVRLLTSLVVESAHPAGSSRTLGGCLASYSRPDRSGVPVVPARAPAAHGAPFMNRRMLQMLGTFVLVVAILGFVKYRQISAAIAANKSFSPPPEAVTTVVAQQTEWDNTLDAVGSIAPVQGVLLSADLPGVVSKVAFNSGARVAEGQVLVQLDTRQEQAQLSSAQAQIELAKVSLDRAKALIDQKAIAQSEYDLASAQYKSAE